MMQALLQRLGNMQIPRRAGLALMTFAAILPVGLSAIGNAEGAKTAAYFGIPIVLLAALAWRGGKRAGRGTKAQMRRVIRQKQAVSFAFSALLFSLLVSDWPRDAAIYGSVALNRNKLHVSAAQARTEAFAMHGWLGYKPAFALRGIWLCSNGYLRTEQGFDHECRAGLVKSSFAKVDYDGSVTLYADETDGEGPVRRRAIYRDKVLSFRHR